MAADLPPTPTNVVMLQAFEWYVPADQKHWKRLTKVLPGLAKLGVANIWIPPACKASSPQGNGYDIYDLYDLGEFDQKNTTATKWGPKSDLIALRDICNEHSVGLYFDVVLNHKAGADRTERCQVVEVNPDDRTQVISQPYDIEGWFGFDFPGRGDTYSKLKWHWYHFSGTDFNNENGRKAIYSIVGKSWSGSVDTTEKGNFDYLMFADVDFSHPEVSEDVKNWGVWVSKELNLKGMRFDAARHFSESFLKDFIAHLDQNLPQDWFFVGEFWQDSVQNMMKYLELMNKKFSLFDAPLLYNFAQTSTSERADLRALFDDTLVRYMPVNAVTVVGNHDTQIGQASYVKMEGWMKPLAYAVILLRLDGYPCVFYGDLFGIKNPDNPEPPSCGGKLPVMMAARKLYSYGEQHDYWDAPNCVGWVRKGTHDKSYGLAVVLSNAEPGTKRMHVGGEHTGEVWTDVLGWAQGEVVIDQDGWGNFTCPAVSCAIWVNKDAPGRENLGEL
ncbi:Alpha-amylase [Dactylella cylindrospora]|nr:Alpha-amylase [Dactylella cylindrospora]